MSLIEQLSNANPVSSEVPDRSVEREALLVARGDANILIIGERGPGKAALARFIHEQSDRSSQGFSIVKCGRLSDEMIRSQLFGHLDDNANSEVLDIPGLLTSRFCGTVFLEEVGALGAATQARLLRYLEASETDAPVRFIASTAVNLKAQVAAGLFLSDLYDRLNARTLAVHRPESSVTPSPFGLRRTGPRPESAQRPGSVAQNSWSWVKNGVQTLWAR